LASKPFHLAKFVFFWLALILAKSGFQNRFQGFSKSFGRFGSGFFARIIFSGKSVFWQSQFFSKGFGKSSALAFWSVSRIFQNKVGLVKNCVACKIKSVKAVFCFLASESCKSRAH